MEFLQGGRDRYYYKEEEDHEEPTRMVPPPSSSSSSSSSALWAPQTAADDVDKPSASVDPAAAAAASALAPPVDKEHMFDKVVTPSDVGKLNRLVIPKQHAEKYFPLDSSANEKGLLLNFEDRTGKPWRFRYSYWNSSQSYVMTKGWSRFVKEKRLDAGDTVSFGRGLGEAGRDRLFIDWKRRPEPHDAARMPLPSHPMMSFTRSVVPWGRLFVPQTAAAGATVSQYDRQFRQSYGYNAVNPYLYLRSSTAGPSVQHLGGGDETVGLPAVFDSMPVVHSNATAKRVRLFGVNLDCPQPPEEYAGGNAVSSQFESQVHPRPPLPALQLRLGAVETVESPSEEKQSSISLDLDI